MGEMNRREFVVGATAALSACALCPSAQAAGAAAKPVDAGLAAEVAAGASDKFAGQGFILVREGKRIYATSSVCTHKRVTLGVQGGQIKCEKHGSIFATTGKVTKGPAMRSLARLGVTKDARGHLIVDPSKQFDEKQWGDAASFVTVD
jgi:nitrite reductase/ring-hydroxylating ferredoxin subunit